jgi:Na+/H+-dicarboxylate symporter
MRTAVNITGDSMVSVIVSKSENSFDDSVFKDPKAGI